MIDQNVPIPKREKTEYPPIPENMYQVELLDINMESKPTYKTRNKPDDQKEYENILSFQFVLLAGKDTDGSDLRGRNIWKNFVPTYLYIGKNGKNALYQIIETCLRRELTPEEEATMETAKLNNLIGKQCRIAVKNITKDNTTYSNIKEFYPVEQDLDSLTDKEKEDARVKKDDDTTPAPEQHDTEQPQAGHTNEPEINVDNIPF